MQTPPTRPIYWLGNIYIGKIFYQQCFGTSFPSQSATKQICIVKKLQIILSPVQASHNIIDTDMIIYQFLIITMTYALKIYTYNRFKIDGMS